MLAWLLVTGGSTTLLAQTPEQVQEQSQEHASAQTQQDLKALMQELSEVKLRNDSFTERKTVALLSEPLEVSGTLYFEAPDHIEKHISTPEKSSYIVHGNALKIQLSGQPERSVVLYQYPGIQAFVESLRATLAGDLKTLKEFYQVQFQAKQGHWKLVLDPLTEEMEEFVRQVVISGEGKQITTIETVENNGDRSVMTLHRVH